MGTAVSIHPPHPNDVDRKRIERALSKRLRYRYVSPEVNAVENGYQIRSPCCSRNIDKSGGMIDIARIEYVAALRIWCLYRKEFSPDQWLLYAEFKSLAELLQHLNQDTERIFWQ